MLGAGVALTGVFGDVVFLVITVAFFGSAWLLVRACERIAGEDVISPGRADEQKSHTPAEDRELVGGRA
jgi:hypothetical protein